jgi:hypothetical protein
MPNNHKTFECITKGSVERRDIAISNLIIAGWTGRDKAAIAAHIEELALFGVPRPASTPIFYRVSAGLLTIGDRIQTMGGDGSGEIEPVYFALEDGLWVGVGSDHTDRKAETQGITLAKQLCPKPVAPTLWRFEDVVDHWDQVTLRSKVVRDGTRSIYQEGPVSAMMRPEDLISQYTGGNQVLPANTAMFGGTMAVEGGIAPADVFEMTLEDPVLGRKIEHSYRIEVLPVLG